MSSITLVRPERERVVDQKAPDAHERPRLPPAFSAALGWTGAALGVYAVEWSAQGLFDGASRASIALVKIAVIVVVGWLYGVAGGVVLVTGIAWLILSIAADVITGIGSADAYQLLGDPTAMSGILRNVTILAWLSAPALFAGGGAPIERGEDSRRHP